MRKVKKPEESKKDSIFETYQKSKTINYNPLAENFSVSNWESIAQEYDKNRPFGKTEWDSDIFTSIEIPGEITRDEYQNIYHKIAYPLPMSIMNIWPGLDVAYAKSYDDNNYKGVGRRYTEEFYMTLKPDVREDVEFDIASGDKFYIKEIQLLSKFLFNIKNAESDKGNFIFNVLMEISDVSDKNTYYCIINILSSYTQNRKSSPIFIDFDTLKHSLGENKYFAEKFANFVALFDKNNPAAKTEFYI